MKCTQCTVGWMVAMVLAFLILVPEPSGAVVTVTESGEVVTGEVLGKSSNSRAESAKAAAEEKKAASEVEREELEQIPVQKLVEDSREARPVVNKQVEKLEQVRVEKMAEWGGPVGEETHANTVREMKLKVVGDDIRVDQIDATKSATTQVIEVLPREDREVVRVRAKENAAYVIRNKVAAKANFPLMVNLETNELMVTTPKGTKIVTVLPDKAVENMLAANVLDQLGGKGGLRWLASQEATPSASPSAVVSVTPMPEDEEGTPSKRISPTPVASGSAMPTPEPTLMPVTEADEEVDTVVELVTEDDGTLAYEIEGTKAKKLFGLWMVTLQRKAVVSAETGELLRVNQDWKTQLLDYLSVN